MHGNGLSLFALRRRAQLRGVPSGGLRVLGLDLHELRPETLDLLFDHFAHVERFDDGPQPPRRSNRLKSGDPRAEHQHLRRRYGTSPPPS